MQSNEAKRKRKKHQGLSVEMLLRKSFKESLREYIKNCSLPGVRQMCDPNNDRYQRLLWTAVFLAAIGTCCYFLLYIWSDILTKPLIVTMESATYSIKEIDFPAVALCNVNRISKKALDTLAREEFADLSKGESLEEVTLTLLNLGRLIDYSYNDSLSNNPIIARFVEKYRFDTQKIITIMKKLAPSCKDMLVRCAWAGTIMDCDRLFLTRRTVYGHCCTFNYVLDYEGSSIPEQKMEVKRQTVPGYIYGLNLILDPMISDYAYTFNPVLGCSVLMFSPRHYPEPRSGRVVHRLAEPNKAMYLELKSTKQIATREVRKYSLATRKCLFRDENKEEFGGMYSYSTCLVFCRMMTIQSLCKCTPFFMAATKKYQKGPICTLDDLKCLNKYKEKLMYLYPRDSENTEGLEMELQDSLFCSECWPDCELTAHYVKGYQTPLFNNDDDEKLLKNVFMMDLNMTDKNYLSIFHSVPDSTLDRLDVVYYWFEILSNIGGFCGVVIGFSALSITKIVYFLTIRLIQNFIKNYKLHR